MSDIDKLIKIILKAKRENKLEDFLFSKEEESSKEKSPTLEGWK